ncbi:MAG TPA: toll/interleukin-1 receptor domain-containing protein [Phycisphaerales bacterium]|nr:toll/interleukin-1 receptor domain-containing protein [Phycisphaerales bacterium]HMP36889.1 toll/interleukin-1 receptor domain-containing protein [Phycisphaerales bacterium]
MRSPKVFISYAHEDEAFNASVGDLAEFLRGEGFSVITDHDHRDTVPPQGWTAWMQHEIEEADFILVVCTPTMKDVFERRRGLPVRGVTIESAFLISLIRKRITDNHSCFPILPSTATGAMFRCCWRSSSTTIGSRMDRNASSGFCGPLIAGSIQRRTFRSTPPQPFGVRPCRPITRR